MYRVLRIELYLSALNWGHFPACSYIYTFTVYTTHRCTTYLSVKKKEEDVVVISICIPPSINTGGGGKGNYRPSVRNLSCPYVLSLSAWNLQNCSTSCCFFISLGMVVYYHEALCHVEKIVHCFHSQGHTQGLQNMTVSTISS